VDALLANLKSVPMSYYLALGAIFALVVLLIVGRIFGAPKAASPGREGCFIRQCWAGLPLRGIAQAVRVDCQTSVTGLETSFVLIYNCESSAPFFMVLSVL